MADTPSISVDLAVGGDVTDLSVSLDLTVTASVPLPVVSVEVDEFGAAIVLEVVSGPNGLELVPRIDGPRGPSGALISVELPGVSGGGKLTHAGDEWRGAATLMMGPLKIAGYALLGPDSLLIVLSARFPQPGIQVGFGFAVSGVGGIFGVNCRSDTQAITAAVLDGSLGNLLFPNDPEHDIGRILDCLPRLFPQKSGQALFGPMLEINWAGGLLRAQAALLLEAPDPVRLSCIGRLIVDLPAPDAPLVHIQATFAAVADFSVPEFRLVASLTGSYIAGLTLTGDLFLLIRGGPEATFVLSVGGFHPAVRPPAGVPALQRVGMAMGFSIAEVRYESYFAVTTCSVQFGARAELTAEVADCGLHGSFGFDALIEWVPRFHFNVAITALVEVEFAGETLLGVRLSGLLEGPAPWHIRAHGEVEVLFVSASITIDETFGSAAPAITAVPDVAGELVAALSDSSAWTLHPPANDQDGVVLSVAAAAAVAKGTLLHPAGSLQVKQRLLPFGITLDRFGGSAVPAQRWQLPGVRLRSGGAAAAPDSPVTDQFAPGMFRTLTQQEQLSSTGFATLPCGGVLSPTGVAMSDVRPAELDWDTVVVGPDLSRTVGDPALLTAVGALDLAPYVAALGRPAPGSGWTPNRSMTVLAEAPTAVVADAPVVGLVPAALGVPLSTGAAAAESVRQLASEGIAAAVVEQWELS
jgi:hypothetical protein